MRKKLHGETAHPMPTDLLHVDGSGANSISSGKALRDRLIDGVGIWGECEDFPRRDWAYEVGNNDTQQGYWDWVIGKHDLDPERTVSEHEVSEVINAVADAILDAVGNPETGLVDAMNLLVNGTLHRLFTNRDATLAEVVVQNYSEDVTIGDVAKWIVTD